MRAALRNPSLARYKAVMADCFRIALAQLNPVVGDIAGNLARARAARATVPDADVILFTELFITGYSPEDLVLKPATSLSGKRVVVTAGPTFEDIDPVRYIGNRSSGRMGFAIAAEAARRGASVTLIAGPTTAAEPAVSELIRVRSAEEMHRAVMAQASSADAVIMAAAVADFAVNRVGSTAVMGARNTAAFPNGSGAR